MTSPPPKPSRDRFFADVLSFGWVLPSAIAVGAGAGWLLDRLFGTAPVLLAVFGLLGFAGGLRQVFQAARRISDENGGNGKE